MDKAMKDALIERAARAIDPEVWSTALPVPTRFDIEAFHARRQASTRKAEAALEATGVFDLVEALEKHAEQHAMMAEMARRVERGSPVSTIDRETGKSKRAKFATVVRTEAEASEKHARAALNRMKEQSND